MKFEWDENKNRLNKKKHGISFETAVQVFLDDKRLERLDANHSSLFEERICVLGRVSDFVILFVVSTDRGGVTRIISARRAEPYEEELYYENINSR